MALPRVLTLDGAAALGLSRRVVATELRHERWQRMTHGVYLSRPDPPTRADWISAGLLLVRGGVVSGWDAVRAHLLGSDRPSSEEVLILSDHGRCRTLGPLRIRRSDRPLQPCYRPIDSLGRRRVASVARAVADTSLVYRRLEPVRALVTSAVQLERCTVEDLVAELDACPRNDSGFFRRAVHDVLGGARSIAEAELGDLLRSSDLPSFRLNVELRTEQGILVGIGDVLWRSLRAVLEVDSRAHHFAERKWRRTMNRHNRFERYGLATTHYAPAEFRDRPHEVLTEIADWLRARARDLGVTYPPPAVDDDGPLIVSLARPA